ncbi:hypothetical protein GGTG_03529 [Gaeumannomyces tritici R3-111a-1]|uniref:Uncharacterized protein n=1 Tax=Gaeumannomyces tritici (strain R3-111a-1) TaxID=644352 RepID=J3NQH2_GAET3|nr:hypothetical protein GGTG_03529 [Gaeumannomyces tritici R3-111a-1]EJT78428.1 hypothetical protein GGTG_03529 [Gaeumannomyces tritici R3-111a-1]
MSSYSPLVFRAAAGQRRDTKRAVAPSTLPTAETDKSLTRTTTLRLGDEHVPTAGGRAIGGKARYGGRDGKTSTAKGGWDGTVASARVKVGCPGQ